MNTIPSLKYLLVIISIAVLIIPINHTLADNSETPDTRDRTEVRILVLDDCDSDKNLPILPCGDEILLLNSKCELLRKIYGIKIHAGGSGHRAISVSEDGCYFTVCRNVDEKITTYETSTGKEIWSLSGKFDSAVMLNNTVYAINGENTYAIDGTGTIIKHLRTGGFDIAADPSGGYLWIVGPDVKKCSFDLEIKMKCDPTYQLSNSVDVDPHGPIWLTIGDDPNPAGNIKLLKISAEGVVLKSSGLNFSPQCLRVDQSDGSVWITGMGKNDLSKLGDEWPETLSELYEIAERETFTCKLDSQGNLLFDIEQGGHSIAFDPSDNSVWIAGIKKILHYSCIGEKLSEYTDVSSSQKWIAVVPPSPNN